MKRKQYGVPGAVDEAPEPQPEDNQYVKVTPLGAGQEVGRSCVILQY
jgi:predicted metal-dependent RNase